MDNRSNMLQLCRLCLVKDDVNIPIFEEHGDIRQIFLKITSCLPVKVSRDDKLPKKICDGCSYKLETLYEFWNTSVNAEKQLLAWLGEAGMNSEMADGTITAVAQQIKPTDTFVKQETVDPPDVHSEDHDQKDYVFQQKFESASAGPSATVTSNEEEEPPPKRARRTAAVKAAIAMDRDSDDDDDSGEPITKVEDESEESDGEDHTFADAPSTSADDQPGPSGVGKDGVDAPSKFAKKRKVNTKNKTKVVEEIENGIQNVLELATPLHCNLCELEFDDVLGFALHSKNHNKDGKYSCNFCDEEISNETIFKRHVLTHIGFQCGLCNKIFSNKSAALNHDGCLEKSYQCDICAKNFACPTTLNNHMASTHRQNENGEPLPRFKCSKCPKHYLHENDLRLHYSSHHKEMGIDCSVICDICGRRLSSISKLKQHSRIHTGDKPYSCSVCLKKFTTRDLATTHLRVHTGEKPYVCKYCGKDFGQRAPYSYHLKIHTGERSFNCSTCGKDFISRGNMKNHARSCNKASSSPDVEESSIKQDTDDSQ